jgi:ATP-dependent Lon protease
MIAAVGVDDPGPLADTIAAHLLVGVDEKQNLLEVVLPLERLTRIADVLEAELEHTPLDRRIRRRIEEQAEQLRRDHYVRERKRAIRNEIDHLTSKIETSDTAPDVIANAAKDLDRLEALSKMPDDAISVPTDFEWPGVLALRTKTRDRPNLEMVQAIMRRERGKGEARTCQRDSCHTR